MRTRQAFRERHDVRPPCIAILLPREPFTTTAEAAHDFVRDEVDASFSCLAPHCRPKVFRCNDAVGACIDLQHHGGHVSCLVPVDCRGYLFGCCGAALLLGARSKWASICVWGRDMRHLECGGVHLAGRSGITGECHRCIACPMIGAIACYHPALSFPTGLARELDSVLIRVGAAQSEKYPAVLKAGLE